MQKLEGNQIFHLLIVDLNLPIQTGDSAGVNDLNYGLNLVEMAANRDHCPIPAILVVSGFLQHATLSSLQEVLNQSFWHGHFVNKSTNEEEEILKALTKAQQYCDIGIHIRGVETSQCPPLTPREEDLLRRSIMGQSNCVGVDLIWWSAKRLSIGYPPSQKRAWTKVLMGTYLLDDSVGISLPTFFKFEQGPEPGYDALRDVRIMEQKLGHIKIQSHVYSKHRGLLVTQKVGASKNPPISLHKYLAEHVISPDLVSHLVADIVQQLSQLGEGEKNLVPVCTLLWSYHDEIKLLDLWEQYADKTILQDFQQAQQPLDCYKRLRTNVSLVWVECNQCTHGDLNATNVAIDFG
jgi:CheY-like chemotaxis protein